MKASRLAVYYQQWINNNVIEEAEQEEVGLGFDAMLSHEVVKFLTTDHSLVKPLMSCVIFKAEGEPALDEHEWAMI